MTYPQKTMIESTWRDSLLELSALYVVAAIAIVQLLSMHWLVAIAVTPFLLAAALFGVAVFVQSLYLIVVGLDRVGSALGMRKSPLA